MDGNSDEQTELLRNIWNEMKALGANLGARIDNVNTSLGARIDNVNTSLGERIDRLTARVDAMGDELKLELRAVRVATQSTFELQSRDQSDLRDRVVRIEGHLGLRPPKRKH